MFSRLLILKLHTHTASIAGYSVNVLLILRKLSKLDAPFLAWGGNTVAILGIYQVFYLESGAAQGT